MKGSKIMIATILSTLIHFFVLTLLDTVPLISKEVPQRNLYMVDLVPLPVEQPAPQQAEELSGSLRIARRNISGAKLGMPEKRRSSPRLKLSPMLIVP